MEGTKENELRRVIGQLNDALLNSDKASVIRVGQDLEDLGLPLNRIECRTVSAEGDRIAAYLDLKTAEVGLTSVNGAADPALMNKYIPLVNFEMVTDVMANRFQDPKLKTIDQMSREELKWVTASGEPNVTAVMTTPLGPMPPPSRPEMPITIGPSGYFRQILMNPN